MTETTVEASGTVDKQGITEVDLSKLDFAIDPESPEFAEWKKTIGTSIAEYNLINKNPTDKRALLVGRFQPPHPGHIFEMLAGLEKAEELVVVVGSPKEKELTYGSNADLRNPFPFEDRVKLLMYFANKLGIENVDGRIKFVHVRDVGNDDLWGKKVLDTVRTAGFGEIDVVVANDGHMPRGVQGIFERLNKRILSLPLQKRNEHQGTVIRAQHLEKGIFSQGGIHRVNWRG